MTRSRTDRQPSAIARRRRSTMRRGLVRSAMASIVSDISRRVSSMSALTSVALLPIGHPPSTSPRSPRAPAAPRAAAPGPSPRARRRRADHQPHHQERPSGVHHLGQAPGGRGGHEGRARGRRSGRRPRAYPAARRPWPASSRISTRASSISDRISSPRSLDSRPNSSPSDGSRRLLRTPVVRALGAGTHRPIPPSRRGAGPTWGAGRDGPAVVVGIRVVPPSGPAGRAADSPDTIGAYDSPIARDSGPRCRHQRAKPTTPPGRPGTAGRRRSRTRPPRPGTRPAAGGRTTAHRRQAVDAPAADLLGGGVQLLARPASRHRGRARRHPPGPLTARARNCELRSSRAPAARSVPCRACERSAVRVSSSTLRACAFASEATADASSRTSPATLCASSRAASVTWPARAGAPGCCVI